MRQWRIRRTSSSTWIGTSTTAGAADRGTVCVEDDGVGMAPEMLSGLFQPFRQADASLNRAQGGLGLGLALAKGIVDLHGGEISAWSAGSGDGPRRPERLG